MKTINFFSAIMIASVLVFTSCQKDNGSGGTTSYKYKLTTSNRSSVVARPDAGSITWASGSAYANLLKFEAKNSSGAEIEYKTPVASQIDIFSSLAQVVGTISLPAGTYSEIEFKAFLTPSGSSTALELNGTFTSGGVTTPVQFIVASNLEIKTEQHSVTVSDGSSYTALTTFDLSTLSSGITEAMLNAATKTGGKIIISATSNTNLYNIMLTRVDDCDHVEFEHD